MHLCSRVKKYVNIKYGLPKDEYVRLSPDEKKEHRKRMALLVESILSYAPNQDTLEVQEARTALNMDALWRSASECSGKDL